MGNILTVTQCRFLLAGILLAIEVLAVVFGGWSGVGGTSDWAKIPPTIPVIIFSLVYHDIAPGENPKFISNFFVH